MDMSYIFLNAIVAVLIGHLIAGVYAAVRWWIDGAEAEGNIFDIAAVMTVLVLLGFYSAVKVSKK